MRKKTGTFEEELYDKMWKTKGNRFNAYERIRTTQRLSFYTTSLLSAYLIIVNLLEPFGLLPADITTHFVSFISVSLSIILLIIVILESSMEYSLKAQNFHNCSKEIGKLFNELEDEMDNKSIDEEKVHQISISYSIILDKYDNHSPIDYALHKTKHKDYFKLIWIERVWIRIRASFFVHFKYYLFIFGVPLVILIWIFNIK